MPLPSSRLSPLLPRCSLPAATPCAVVSVHRPTLPPSPVSLLLLRDCSSSIRIAGLWSLTTAPDSYPWLSPLPGFAGPFLHNAVLAPVAVTDHLSSTTSHVPTDECRSIQAWSLLLPEIQVSSLFSVASGGASALSLLLLPFPSRSPGFYPPLCYQASSAPGPQYYP